MQSVPTILMFSHLRWDFVYQRPQHLLSRLASSRRVIFIEEPILSESSHPQWQFHQPEPNVLVCRPQTPVRANGFHNEQMPYLKELVRELVEGESLENYVLWFYTPMAYPLAAELRPRAVVYDCMDELSAFLNAPAESDRARGRFNARRRSRVYRRPEPVPRQERPPSASPLFSEQRGCETLCHGRQRMQEAGDQADLPHPRLGYFGVIDERLDTQLIEAMADARPEWSLVLVGPVVKIDPATLPRRPNIRYFGQRPYKQLPAYLKGWDVCLLPFARNQSTKFISPDQDARVHGGRQNRSSALPLPT